MGRDMRTMYVSRWRRASTNKMEEPSHLQHVGEGMFLQTVMASTTTAGGLTLPECITFWPPKRGNSKKCPCGQVRWARMKDAAPLS